MNGGDNLHKSKDGNGFIHSAALQPGWRFISLLIGTVQKKEENESNHSGIHLN